MNKITRINQNGCKSNIFQSKNCSANPQNVSQAFKNRNNIIETSL